MANSKSIDRAVEQALAATGVMVKGGIPTIKGKDAKKKARPWTTEEDEWLRKHARRMSWADCGAHLRRSAGACKIRASRELKIDHLGLSKSELTLSGEHVASGLGIDGKSVHAMMDRGLMPGARATWSQARRIRLVERVAFMRWLMDPMHWIYFKPEHVGAMRRRGKRAYMEIYDFAFWEQAGQLVQAAAKKWKDRWLTTRQAGALMGVDHKNINAAIRAGKLKSTRWQNWKVLKSDMPITKVFNAKGILVDKIYPRGKHPQRRLGRYGYEKKGKR